MTEATGPIVLPNHRWRRPLPAIVAVVALFAILWQHWSLASMLESTREEQRERERFITAALVAEPEDRRFLRETLSEMDPLIARLLRRAGERKAWDAADRLRFGDELRRTPTRTTPPLVEQRTPRRAPSPLPEAP